MSDLTLGDFAPGQSVLYVPYHAHDDQTHPDCERGTVSSVNDSYVFVRFAKAGGELANIGQACKPDQLVKRL